MNATENESSPCKKRRWPRRVAIALAVVIVAGGAVFFAYFNDCYHANETVEQYFAAWENTSSSANAEAASGNDDPGGTDAGRADGKGEAADSSSTENTAAEAIGPVNGIDQAASQRTVIESDSFIALGNPASEYGLILYPGAKVEPAAYMPLMEKIADEGIYCVMAKMPFNFAFFNINAADALMATVPDIKHWWIGGHSLGGVVAATYAADHADALEGIALLAAYSTENLNVGSLRAVVLYGSNDLVVNRESLAKDAGNLPADSQTVVIEGGNHAGFGDYGAQEGDGDAAISADEQRAITASAIADAMKR